MRSTEQAHEGQGMKFTILSHAGLCVEHNGVRIVPDPWLLGSCYWRSWWNFPEPPAELIKNPGPTTSISRTCIGTISMVPRSRSYSLGPHLSWFHSFPP